LAATRTSTGRLRVARSSLHRRGRHISSDAPPASGESRRCIGEVRHREHDVGVDHDAHAQLAFELRAFDRGELRPGAKREPARGAGGDDARPVAEHLCVRSHTTTAASGMPSATSTSSTCRRVWYAGLVAPTTRRPPKWSKARSRGGEDGLVRRLLTTQRSSWRESYRTRVTVSEILAQWDIRQLGVENGPPSPRDHGPVDHPGARRNHRSRPGTERFRPRPSGRPRSFAPLRQDGCHPPRIPRGSSHRGGESWKLSCRRMVRQRRRTSRAECWARRRSGRAGSPTSLASRRRRRRDGGPPPRVRPGWWARRSRLFRRSFLPSSSGGLFRRGASSRRVAGGWTAGRGPGRAAFLRREGPPEARLLDWRATALCEQAPQNASAEARPAPATTQRSPHSATFGSPWCSPSSREIASIPSLQPGRYFPEACRRAGALPRRRYRGVASHRARAADGSSCRHQPCALLASPGAGRGGTTPAREARSLHFSDLSDRGRSLARLAPPALRRAGPG
jgi:hypothetical protein